MPKIDPPDIEEKIDDKPEVKVKVTDDGKFKYEYKRDHNKSMRQIAQEGVERDKKAVETPTEEVETPEEEPEKTKEPDKVEAPVVDVEKVAKEAVEKAAADAAVKFKDELTKIKDSEASALEKKKQEDELLTQWDKEGRLPADYKEIFNEAQRISEAKMRREWDARESKAKEEATAKKTAEDKAKQETESQITERQKQLNDRVNSELDELVSSKHIARGKDGQLSKEAEDLLNFGIKLNTERVAKGEAPIDSVQRIYFMHYKPIKDKAAPKVDDQPAGADAPVSGAKGSAHSDAPADKYVYARDHGKSFRQLAQDTMRRVTGR